MKVTFGSIVAFIAGTWAAAGSGAKGKWRSNHVAARDIMQAMEDKTNLRFAQATMAKGYLVSQPIHGRPDDVNNFISSLSFTDLKSILEPKYGFPFCLDFYNTDSGDGSGNLCGYFTPNSEFKVDDTYTRLPRGASKPGIPKEPSVAPQPVTVTANEQQSDRAVKAGRVTDGDLRQLLGGDYGKPFKVILNGSGSGSGGGGSITGTFGPSGAMFDDNKNSPKPRTAGSKDTPATSAQNAPTDAAPEPNTGSVVLSGSRDEIKSQLNSLTYDYILKAVGGTFGPYYISMKSEDGSIEGYIKGEIHKDGRYFYKWAYTYKSE